jgi:hypothetical protein
MNETQEIQAYTGKTGVYSKEREREATVRDIGAREQDCRTGNNTDIAKYL